MKLENPELDGITHINIYSKAKTELGRLLSNFAYSPMKVADGEFASVEAYWYWLNCSNPKRDDLKPLFGFQAKNLGRELKAKDYPAAEKLELEFKPKIHQALIEKTRANEKLRGLLLESTLPFCHYYVYGNKVLVENSARWLIQMWDQIRNELKEGTFK